MKPAGAKLRRKFILNPGAGSQDPKRLYAELEEHFKARTGSFDCEVTGSAAEVVAATRRALHEGYGQIVALGGDGTVNRVANGFFEGGRPINDEALLAVAKLGSGGDFYKTLTKDAPEADWRELVLEHEARRIDIGQIRYSRPDQAPELFVNMCSLGMVPAIVQDRHALPRWIPASLQYMLPTVKQVFQYAQPAARIRLDDEEFDGPFVSLFISKGLYAGAGMLLGMNAVPDDGLFDVTLVQGMGTLEMLPKLGKLKTGIRESEPGLVRKKCSSVSVSAHGEPMPVEFDGELIGTTDVEVRVRKAALRVCFAGKA